MAPHGSSNAERRKQHALLSWSHGEQTARQLFEALDSQGLGAVSIAQVCNSWPGEGGHELEYCLLRLKDNAKIGTGENTEVQLTWPEFRAAVRLWRSLYGQRHSVPSLRGYMLQSLVETCTGTTVSMLAAEAACLACAGSEAWQHICSLGGLGVAVALVTLDGSSMSPCFAWADRAPRSLVNLGSSSRLTTFLAACASSGVMLAPAAPLLSATIGDPKSRGHGPLAVAALGVAQFVGHASLLMVLPGKCFARREPGKPTEASSDGRAAAVLGALAGGLVAGGLGLAAASVSGRQGARTTVLCACGCLSAHAGLTAVLGAVRHAAGRPEPLQPALDPALGLLGAAQRLMPHSWLQ
eukprot:TRINITY_DN105346_c0_g1_i1.p1 TRINITY_DN105346_c0_g1~~TRINITY_DN105346_c0_g1_i1.p1  ORF type:complete len:364 (-),score=42.54 TRINITY_DN105346_c0_g1_i1:74-1135(-)